MEQALPLRQRARKPLHGRAGSYRPSPFEALLLVALLGVMGFIAYTLYARFSGLNEEEAAAPTYIPAFQTTLTTSVSTTGTVAATQQVELSFDIGQGTGKIAQMLVNLSDQVEAGQVLAKLDDTDLQQSLTSANSSLASAQARLAAITQPSTADIAGARQSVVAAEQQVLTAQKALDDLKAEPKAAEVLSAQQNVTSAQSSLSNAQTSLTKAQNQIQSDQVQVTEASNDLKAAQTTLSSAASAVQYPLSVLRTALQTCNGSPYASTPSFTTGSQNKTYSLPYGYACSAASAEIKAANLASVTSAVASYNSAVNSYNSALSGVTKAQASVSSAQLTLTNDQNSLSSLRSAVDNAQVALKTAQQKYEDAKAPATAAELQAAQKSIEVARASLANANAQYQKLLNPPDDEILPLSAAVDSAQASVASAEKNLAAATITAPFAGKISQVNGDVGTGVNANSSVFVLVNPDLVRIEAAVDQAYISKLQAGQMASVTFDALNGYTYAATVDAIGLNPTTSSGVVTYVVTFSMDTSKLAAGTPVPAPGMTASIAVTTSRAENALVVPAKALRNNTVTVRTATGTEQRAVTTGISNGTLTQITSGLELGEEVLVTTTTATAGTSSGSSGQGQFGGGPPPGGGFP